MVVIINILSVQIKGQYAFLPEGPYPENKIAYQQYKGGQQEGKPHLVFVLKKVFYTVYRVAQIFLYRVKK